VALAAGRPEAAVLGHPVFDESTPRGRRAAHGLTNFWTRIETAGGVISDPQCGYRVYPLEATIGVDARGDRMDFDIEIAVRLVWAGVPIINLPTRVRYLPQAVGGVSHFRPVRDNLSITWMHIRLVFASLLWRLGRVWRRVAKTHDVALGLDGELGREGLDLDVGPLGHERRRPPFRRGLRER
jgi:hypothetical protein